MKLNNVQVCLDPQCEECFIGDYCPKCGGHDYFYLRKYFKPMNTFREGRYEPVTVRKYNQIPEDLHSIQSDSLVTAVHDGAGPVKRGFDLPIPIEAHPQAVSQRTLDEIRSVSKSGGLDYTSRVLGEAISRLLKICGGLNADQAKRVETME